MNSVQFGGQCNVQILIQVRELVSSNVSAMVETATSPAKMLRHLRKTIEETDIALHGELTKLRRRHERALAEAETLVKRSDDWSDKARIAMSKGREDLARAALLAREDGKLLAEERRRDSSALEAEIAEGEDALKLLAGKLAETNEQLKLADAQKVAGTPPRHAEVRDSNTTRRLDHIATLERRIGFALDDTPAKEKTLSEAEIDAEILGIQRSDAVDAQLEQLKAEVGNYVGKDVSKQASKSAKRKSTPRKKAG